MKAKRWITIVNLFFIIFCCHPGQLSAMTISGLMTNFPQQEIKINVLFWGYAMPSDDQKIALGGDGAFSVDLEIEEERFAELSIGEKKLQLFLTPGNQKLTVNVDYEDFENSLTFQGDLAVINTFFNNRPYPNYYKRAKEVEPAIRMDPVKVDSLFDEEKRKEMQALEGIKNSLVPKHFEIIRKEISNYYLAVRIQAGLNVKQFRNGREIYREKWSKRNDSLAQQISCDESYKYGINYNRLINVIYIQIRPQYSFTDDSLHWFKEFNVNSMEEFYEKISGDKYNLNYYMVGKKGFCPEVFEKALANRIYRAQDEGDFENLDYIYHQYVKHYPNSPFLDEIKPRMARYLNFFAKKNQETPGIYFHPIQNDFKVLDDIISQNYFKGKVIVIDIWGTWCGPCREEFRYVNELKSKLDTAEVAFLYLANEKNIKDPEPHWKEAAKFYELTGYHYLLNQEVLLDFWDKATPNSRSQIYPTYMILDRKGQIAIRKAAKPSDGDKLLRQIKNVINKK